MPRENTNTNTICETTTCRTHSYCMQREPDTYHPGLTMPSLRRGFPVTDAKYWGAPEQQLHQTSTLHLAPMTLPGLQRRSYVRSPNYITCVLCPNMYPDPDDVINTKSFGLVECFALSRCCHILARLKLSLIFSYGMLNELICNMYHLLHICGINLLPSTPISSSLNPPQALYSHLKLFKPISGPLLPH